MGNSTMALNPNYDAIGKAFVQQYYALFDDKNARPNLVNLYNAEQSLMTFERIAHSITAIDCQPMFDGGILINVLGQLKTDEDPPHSFLQTFVLQNSGGSWFIGHDTFRLVLHNIAT